jgi:uncharacterized protein (DUF2062 family)
MAHTITFVMTPLTLKFVLWISDFSLQKTKRMKEYTDFMLIQYSKAHHHIRLTSTMQSNEINRIWAQFLPNQ